MKRIVTVTLNPAIDRTLVIPSPVFERVVRVLETYEYPSGKGVNVARVLKRRGFSVLCLGFFGGANGKKLIQGLQKEGLDHDFTLIEGETRGSLTIRDPTSRLEGHLVESGPFISEKEKVHFLKVYLRSLKVAEFIALCGSLPPGLGEDFYALLASEARRAGIPVALDTSGAPLQRALLAKPQIVKPNRQELSQISGRSLVTESDLKERLVRLVTDWEVSWATVSLGKEGMIGTDGKTMWKGVPPLVNPVNTIGSGDAALAGLIEAWVTGRSLKEAVHLAVVLGTANILVDGPGYIREEDVTKLMGTVRVFALD